MKIPKPKSPREIQENRDKMYKMQEWERVQNVAEQTQLFGKWEDIQIDCPFCDQDNAVYIFDDNQTCYCLACMEEFDVSDSFADISGVTEYRDDIGVKQSLEDLVSDDPVTVNEAIKAMEKGQTYVSGTSKVETGEKGKTSVGFSYSDGVFDPVKKWTSDKWSKVCTHRPTHIIDGDTWGVWAGKKWDIKGSVNNFDVVLNLQYDSIRTPHIIPIPELARYEDGKCTFTELQIDWPDYGVPDLPREFWIDLLKYLQDNKLRMLVFCMGGHGRTGTAITIMMCLALGMTQAEAKAWVHENYCDQAIETMGQEKYIESMLVEPKEDTADTADLWEEKGIAKANEAGKE